MLRQSMLLTQLHEGYRQASSCIILAITIQFKLQKQAGNLHLILRSQHTLLSNVLLQFCQTCNCYSSCQLDGPCCTHTVDHRVTKASWQCCNHPCAIVWQLVIPAAAFALHVQQLLQDVCVGYLLQLLERC